MRDKYWSVDGGVQGDSEVATWEVTSSSPVLEGFVLHGAQLLPSNQNPADLLGQNLTIMHESLLATGCLDVQWAHARNGQNVQTWECNGTNAQVWRLERRTAGDEAGRFRLVSGVGDGETYCLDNRGQYRDSDMMGIWSCVADDHHAVPNQTFDLAQSGGGWTLTFTRDNASSVLWAERATDRSRGNVGQRSGGSGQRAAWRIVSDEPSPSQPVVVAQAVFSVSDAAVTEAAGANLAFTVSLDRAVLNGDGTVSVDYATRDVTATAGADYTAASGTLTFAVGDREKTVNVAVLEDAHDDDGETLELVLSNAVGASIADGTGTGTINNADPLPKAWLARLGRTVAEQVLDGVRERRDAARVPGEAVTLAGQVLMSSGEAEGLSQSPAYSEGQGLYTFGEPGWENADLYADGFDEARTLTAREALLGASFALTGAQDASGGTLALWGRVAESAFEGRKETLMLDGEVTTGLVGVDYGREDWLTGLVISQTDAEGGYADDSSGSGTLGSSLTAATVYGAMNTFRRLELWGAAGYGRGELTLTPSSGTRAKVDINWTMAAAGARGELAGPGAGGGLMLALVSDALWARTASDEDKVEGLVAARADVTRLRLGVEGGWTVQLGGSGALTPALDLGLRHDGGDAETGIGVEIGGGFAWSDPALGLSLDLSGRTLVVHEDDDFKDWGISAGLIFDPSPATGRGPSFSLRHELAGAPSGGLEALFAPEPLARRTGSEAAGAWTTQAAWGFPAFGGNFTGSPHAGLGLTDTARDYTLGWRLAPEGPSAPDFSFDLKATRRESEGVTPEHGVEVEAAIRW